MDAFLRAVETFLGHLSDVAWGALAIALVFHALKVAARTRAWRNILAAAYPDVRVPWRGVFGAYAAGVGVNALLPARGGDLLKLYLVKRQVPGSSYPTLASTLLVETLFDLFVATALVLWAIQLGVLPGLDVLSRMPTFEWRWVLEYPLISVGIGVAAVLVFAFLLTWASRHVAAFGARVAQGFAVLGDPPLYLRSVVAWQALDWILRLVTVYWFLRAFGLDATVHNVLIVQFTETVSTALPLTPAGIGTEQALLLYVFSGTAPAIAVVSFSVGMKLTIVAFNVLLGFGAIVLMMRTVRWRRGLAGDRASIERLSR
jgi:uncharacterized membrane protein YbhN (UPF0104 family)